MLRIGRRPSAWLTPTVCLTSALKVRPTAESRRALAAFAEDIYLHQVIARAADGTITRYKDLDLALQAKSNIQSGPSEEWRIHFHIPLYGRPTPLFDTTADHILGVMDLLREHPGLCSHIEMETYTWEILPPELKNRSVIDHLAAEYEWTLNRLAERGLTSPK